MFFSFQLVLRSHHTGRRRKAPVEQTRGRLPDTDQRVQSRRFQPIGQMLGRGAALQGAPGRTGQILPLGGEIQLPKRTGRLPPDGERVPLAGGQTARNGARGGEFGLLI